MRLLLALLLLVPSAQAARLFELESPAGPGSLAPSLVALDNGRAVLAWLEEVDAGHALRFSIFDGTRFGDVVEIARGEDWFANWADTPAIHVLPDGDWLAHWLVKSGPATYAYDIVMARSDDHGASWSEPFSPHDDGTQTEHGFVSYFDWDPTRAGLVWLDGRETGAGSGGAHEHEAQQHPHHGGGAMTLRTAAVGADGELTHAALLDGRVCDCCQTAAAMTAEGPIVIYRGRDPDEVRDIRLVRFSQGQWSAPRILHADGWQIGGCPVNGPALIADGRQVVAAWFTMADGQPRVQVSRSTDAGERFDAPVSLGSGTALGRVGLSWIDGGYVVSWVDEVDREGRLMLSVFNQSGELDREVLLAGLVAGRISGFPRQSALSPQVLLLAWTESGLDRRPVIRLARADLDQS
jgi:hypothetical protein